MNLHKVLQKPHTTEKNTILADKHNQIVFKVALDATKTEIKAAVKKFFGADVAKVCTSRQLGKKRKFRQHTGKRSNWKKAFVILKSGQDINFKEFE